MLGDMMKDIKKCFPCTLHRDDIASASDKIAWFPKGCKAGAIKSAGLMDNKRAEDLPMTTIVLVIIVIIVIAVVLIFAFSSFSGS